MIIEGNFKKEEECVYNDDTIMELKNITKNFLEDENYKDFIETDEGILIMGRIFVEFMKIFAYSDNVFEEVSDRINELIESILKS